MQVLQQASNRDLLQRVLRYHVPQHCKLEITSKLNGPTVMSKCRIFASKVISGKTDSTLLRYGPDPDAFSAFKPTLPAPGCEAGTSRPSRRNTKAASKSSC